MASQTDQTPTIQDLIETTYAAIDPQLDTQKGPLRRLFLDPHRSVLGLAEARVNRLIALFTQQRPANMTTDEYNALIRPFGGIARFQGSYATGFVIVYAYTAPPADVTIPFGTVFTDSTGTLIYGSSADVTVLLANMASYYNPTARRYEFQVPIIAKEVGDQSAVPPDTITVITSSLPYLNGCNNDDALTGGLPAESDTVLDTRFQARLEGTDNGSKGSLSSLVLGVANVLAVVLISPGSPLYSRRTSRLAVDVHVIGTNPQKDQMAITVTNPNQRVYQFILPDTGLPRRVTAIDSVVSGGSVTVTNWSLIPDTTRMGNSVFATTAIEFTAGFPLDTQLLITYQYDQVLEDVQSIIGLQASYNEYLFDVSLLTFAAVPVPLEVSFSTSALTSANTPYMLQQLRTVTLSLLNPSTFVGTMTADDFTTQLQAQVPAASPQYTLFHRKDSSQPVEVLFFSDVEYPTLSGSDLYIRAS